MNAHASELQHLQTQCIRRPWHARALLAATIVAVIGAGAILWHQDSDAAHQQRLIPTPEPAWHHHGSLQADLRAAESALEQARQKADQLHRQIAELDGKGQKQVNTSRRGPRRGRKPERPRDQETRHSQPAPAPIDLRDCADSPLGCTE